MSGEINTGGPAFPQNDLSGYGMGPAERNNGGMTLRDWFAGQALNGLICANDGIEGTDPLRAIAFASYAMADAMLAAREAKP